MVVVHDQLVRTELDEPRLVHGSDDRVKEPIEPGHQLVVTYVGSGDDTQAPGSRSEEMAIAKAPVFGDHHAVLASARDAISASLVRLPFGSSKVWMAS